MRPLHIYLSFLLFFLPTIAFSQAFMQGVGISYVYGKTRMREPNSNYWPTIDFRGMTYFPRLNVQERDQTAVSIGLPFVFGLSVGLGSSVNSFSYVVDVPLVVDYNFGHHATKSARGIFGGYVGAGIGLTHEQNNVDSDFFPGYRSTQTSYGPLARAGLRFRIPLNVGELSFTLGAFYKIGLEEERYKLRGANFLMNF